MRRYEPLHSAVDLLHEAPNAPLHEPPVRPIAEAFDPGTVAFASSSVSAVFCPSTGHPQRSIDLAPFAVSTNPVVIVECSHGQGGIGLTGGSVKIEGRSNVQAPARACRLLQRVKQVKVQVTVSSLPQPGEQHRVCVPWEHNAFMEYEVTRCGHPSCL